MLRWRRGVQSLPMITGLRDFFEARCRERGYTLDEVKKRGTFRVGVTQAPPWFSKDPKSGQWNSGLGIFMGKAMADALGAKVETVEVSWGNSIAALQGDKIDIMVDVNTRYTWLDCQRALPALEECNIYWLEEPFTPDAS
mgnify:CR=1 FL=1